MTNITIFGQGNMGQAIAGIFKDGGNIVNFVGRESEGTISDIVVFAVPYSSVSTIVERYKEALKGKIIIDITNPVDFSTMDSLVTPLGSSAAEEIAKLLPESSIVKGFNTNFGSTLVSKKVNDTVKTTVQLASDDENAKMTVASLIKDAGITVIDAGELKRARELEAMGFLQITLAVREQISWTGGFGIIK